MLLVKVFLLSKINNSLTLAVLAEIIAKKLFQNDQTLWTANLLMDL